ncbi:CoA transferase [Amycolatopsis sp. GM8]|uniref:CoA transferase n=1 Tax=Amycolatopsis sp. GM8 TaxID=2896530 RepID=UPI001F24BC06|nr:CoA transferase [Amycolatopsis sp. GM8]
MSAEPDPVADWVRSGVVALTGPATGPPLVPPGRAATFAREVAARCSLPVDGALLLSERAAFTGHHRRGAVSVGGSCRILPAADGWAAMSCARPDDPLLFGALVGAELPADPWPAIAHWVAEHTGDELVEAATPLGLAAGPIRVPAERPCSPRPDRTRSVAGLLVVDFSSLWAGPLCAHLLGLLGANVVKVETPQRPDGARRGEPEFYRLLHAGHRSVVLDPETASGRRALARLVETADIVIEASRPRALARFGLDALAAAEAGTIWVSITAYGRKSDRVGFGDDVAAANGLVARGEDGTPYFCGDAIADPLTGLVATELARTAPDDGQGVLYDVAMADVVASTLDPALPGSPLVEGTPAAPRRRTVAGTAPASGAHTAEVLRELGIS